MKANECKRGLRVACYGRDVAGGTPPHDGFYRSVGVIDGVVGAGHPYVLIPTYVQVKMAGELFTFRLEQCRPRKFAKQIKVTQKKLRRAMERASKYAVSNDPKESFELRFKSLSHELGFEEQK